MVFFPGSKVPFNPINPHGSKAKVPHGWVSPFKEPRFRVHVDTPLKESQPITPGMGKLVVEELCATVRAAIKAGNVTGWSNPHVRPV